MDGAAAFDYAVFAGAPAATVKVICPDTLHCLALVPSEDRLSFAAANPWDTYQRWEYIFQPDGSSVNLDDPARWMPQKNADGAIHITCANAMPNCKLMVAPWGHEQQGNGEMDLQAAHENDHDAASNEDDAAGAPKRSRCFGCLFP